MMRFRYFLQGRNTSIAAARFSIENARRKELMIVAVGNDEESGDLERVAESSGASTKPTRSSRRGCTFIH